MGRKALRKVPAHAAARTAVGPPAPSAIADLAHDITDIAHRRGQSPTAFCDELIRQAQRRAA